MRGQLLTRNASVKNQELTPSPAADDSNGNCLWDPGESYVDNNSNGAYDAPTWDIGTYWEPTSATNIWCYTFKTQTAAYDAIQNYTPFRGECAGAIQLCLLNAAADELGETRFNSIHSAGITIGSDWTAYSQHTEGAADTLTHVPGDYVYIANKDDYLTFSPGGFWQGENLVYDGGGTYTGLGENKKTEGQWRDLLQDHYNNECEEPYEDLNGNGAYDAGEPFEDRDGDLTWDDPHVDDTEAETAIRFTNVARIKAGD